MARIVARSWFQIHLFMTICIKKAILNLKNTVNIFAGHIHNIHNATYTASLTSSKNKNSTVVWTIPQLLNHCQQ